MPASALMPCCRNPRECAVAKEALLGAKDEKLGRNPHECAVAKGSTRTAERQVRRRNPRECAVAKAHVLVLMQPFESSQPARMRCGKVDVASPAERRYKVATRANALWQSSGWAVFSDCRLWSQPARMRCGKGRDATVDVQPQRRNPHECAEAKHVLVRGQPSSFVATRTNALRQSKDGAASRIIPLSQPARMR